MRYTFCIGFAVAPLVTMVAVLGCLCLSWTVRNAKAGEVQAQKSDSDFDQILAALVVYPLGPRMTNEQNRATYRQQLLAREWAIAELRQLGSNCLNLVIERIRTAESMRATNQAQVTLLASQLRGVFEALGETAKPLLPQLVEEFRAARNVSICAAGMMIIGGTEAGMVLSDGLTNSQARIRASALSALTAFHTNREVVVASIPRLVLLLGDNSESLRAHAAAILGDFHVETGPVIPSLLRVAQSDSDSVVRSQAIRAIGRFGTNASHVRHQIELVAERDPDIHNRRMAKQVSEAISEGKNSN